MKIGKFNVIEKFDNEEPVYCERKGCHEEFNASNHFMLDCGDWFVMDMWLCNECAKKFRERFK